MKLHYTPTEVKRRKHAISPIDPVSLGYLCDDYLQLWDEVERLSAIVGRQARTADDVLVEDGKTYYFRCANGLLEFVAYLGPQFEHLTPYPWDKGYSTPEAAEAEEG